VSLCKLVRDLRKPVSVEISRQSQGIGLPIRRPKAFERHSYCAGSDSADRCYANDALEAAAHGRAVAAYVALKLVLELIKVFMGSYGIAACSCDAQWPDALEKGRHHGEWLVVRCC
jgi:hypothetical protein